MKKYLAVLSAIAVTAMMFALVASCNAEMY